MSNLTSNMKEIDKVGEIGDIIHNVVSTYNMNEAHKNFKNEIINSKEEKAKQELANSVISTTERIVESEIRKNAKVLGVDEILLVCDVIAKLLSNIAVVKE